MTTEHTGAEMTRNAQYRRHSDRLGAVTIPPRDCSECGNYYDIEPHEPWCTAIRQSGHTVNFAGRYNAR